MALGRNCPMDFKLFVMIPKTVGTIQNFDTLQVFMFFVLLSDFTDFVDVVILVSDRFVAPKQIIYPLSQTYGQTLILELLRY